MCETVLCTFQEEIDILGQASVIVKEKQRERERARERDTNTDWESGGKGAVVETDSHVQAQRSPAGAEPKHLGRARGPFSTRHQPL